MVKSAGIPGTTSGMTILTITGDIGMRIVIRFLIQMTTGTSYGIGRIMVKTTGIPGTATSMTGLTITRDIGMGVVIRFLI